MTYTQFVTDIDLYTYDFTPYFKRTDTIASASVSATPAGLVEVLARRFTEGVKQSIYIDAGSATPGEFTVACQAVSSSGLRRTLTKIITVVAETTGITPVPPATAGTGQYSAVLAQAGATNPTVTKAYENSLPAGTPVWTRSAEGVLIGTLVGAFLANKTRVKTHIVPYQVGNEAEISGKRLTDDTVEVRVTDFAGNPVDGFAVADITILTYD